ncbi:MAG: elongation factor Ts [Dehalococcoidia bacterium]|nr:elongation factor Ts [Chloroflexota bacterium]MXY36297.1 elongation factor Ts [Dehalococcoidia bacterium]MYK26707.1 elongation factor Ts [Dehalococcoidia bacterium]
MVKELRDASGSGVMDAKRALEEADGDMTQAATILRERGLAAAAKRAERETGQGVVDTYIHAGGRIGALVEVNCETDFVANTDEFRSLVHEIAMQVAAMNPAVVSADDREPELEGADDEVALLSQPWVKDASKTISDLVQDSMAKTGENIRVRRFARFELGS